MKYSSRQKITYFFKAKHRKGHGIHSPFLFRLITQVIENKGNFSAYPILKAADENVRGMLRILDMESYHGKNIAVTGFTQRDIQELHLLPERFDRMIFRLINDFGPGSLAFYGSTFGTTLIAMALADSRISLEAQVENDHYRSFCRQLAEVYEVENLHITKTGSVLNSDFVVIQQPMNPGFCDQIVGDILQNADFNGVVVLCAIHSSAEMEEVWLKHKKDKVVRIALDIFEIGLLICIRGLQKEDFVLRF